MISVTFIQFELLHENVSAHNIVSFKNLPHRCTIEVYHHPFWRVKGKRVCVFDSIHVLPELWTYESSSCIRCINMYP